MRPTYDTSGHIRVEQSPCQGEMSGGRSELLSKLGKLAHLLDLRLALWGLESFDVLAHHRGVGVVPRTLGDAIIVFSGKQAGVQRRPDGAAISRWLSRVCQI